MKKWFSLPFFPSISSFFFLSSSFFFRSCFATRTSQHEPNQETLRELNESQCKINPPSLLTNVLVRRHEEKDNEVTGVRKIKRGITKLMVSSKVNNGNHELDNTVLYFVCCLFCFVVYVLWFVYLVYLCFIVFTKRSR